MLNQPSFPTPAEAIEFIGTCLRQGEPDRLYSAFTEEPGEFWKDRLFQSLRDIQESETLERVFLQDGVTGTLPEHEPVLHLGGHNPRTHYLHIKLVRAADGWVLESIHVCR